jgi:hypothetical protein
MVLSLKNQENKWIRYYEIKCYGSVYIEPTLYKLAFLIVSLFISWIRYSISILLGVSSYYAFDVDA